MKAVHFFWHLLLGLVMIAGFGIVVMLLWNWLMPVLLGWTVIGFWQALGLLVLSRILFGGLGKMFAAGRMRHHTPGHWHRMRSKWLKMTDEERKEFLKHRHFGHGFGCDFFQQNESGKQEQRGESEAQ